MSNFEDMWVKEEKYSEDTQSFFEVEDNYAFLSGLQCRSDSVFYFSAF